LEREVTSKAGGTRRLSTGDTADYQSAVRQLADIPSHYLRQVTNLNQDWTGRWRDRMRSNLVKPGQAEDAH
jgi:hypothetical protein